MKRALRFAAVWALPCALAGAITPIARAGGEPLVASRAATPAARTPTLAPRPARPAAARHAAVTSAAASATAKRPDFSGTWLLDLAKTEFGKLPGKPKTRTDVIVHREPWLRQTLQLVLSTGPDSTVYGYRTDSTESVNWVGKQPVRARVWWAGDTLRLESRTRFGPVETTLSDRWIMAPDGKTLTMARRVKFPMGEGEQRLVFTRR